MEGGSPSEIQRVLRSPKQHSQSSSRTAGQPEHLEATHSPHAILESKVKALKEKRGGGRPGTPAATPERSSPKKPRARRGKLGVDVAVVEPRAQLRTYLTDGLLDGGEPVASSPSAPRVSTPGLWRVPAPKGAVLGSTNLSLDEGIGSQISTIHHERSALEEETQTPPQNRRVPLVSPTMAEGWERLSLAERVERNRRLLQEVLGLTMPQVPASDGDWDSGVSLQDAEGCRAFVPGQELQLSPRHEQAKQLLQRARMKARTNPLRASHDILLAAAVPHPREPSGRLSIAPRDGGSLSDSSSGESSCGRARRPRGPSPSRVRFEDESARDAEVRYLERLQLRHRRALGSGFSPEPASGGQPGDRTSQPKARSGDLVAGGKCSACGSFLAATTISRGTDTPATTSEAESSPAAKGSTPGGSAGPSAARPEPKTRALGPRGSPLWILPSRQRIHTEKIKETYIGNVTYIDEVDSALESTDTSDGCRTDSEEAGPHSPHSRGHRDPRARGHRVPSAVPHTEARAGKGTCVVSAAPHAGDRRSGSAASQVGAISTPPPGTASTREDASHQRSGGSKGAGSTPHAPQQPSETSKSSSQPAMPGTHLPVPPPTRKACSPVPCRKALFSSGSRRASSQEAQAPEPNGGSTASCQPAGTVGSGERRGPCSPRWLPGSPLRALSTNNCNNTCGQDPSETDKEAPSHPTSQPQDAAHPPAEVAGTPGVQQQQQDSAGSAAHRHTRDEHRPPPSREPGRPPSRKSSSASASGLKKLLCSLSQSTKQRLGRFRCYSMEQLPAPDGTPPDGPSMKKSPSLQSLRLVSPFCQPQKATSVQSLHPLLGKGSRASAYLLPQTTGDRKGGSGPRRSLSVEDIGAPGRLRAVGRVVEVFPDGTSQLELQRPPSGAFGFCVSSGNGRPDTAASVGMGEAGCSIPAGPQRVMVDRRTLRTVPLVPRPLPSDTKPVSKAIYSVYVQEMADAGTAKLYAGLLGVGDEILQVNGEAVSALGLPRIQQLLLRADTLSLRVLKHRPAPR